MRERLVNWVVAVAGAFGFNKVRIRWRLNAWLERSSRQAAQAGQTVKHVGYKNVICPHCGALQEQGDTCIRCGKGLGGRPGHMLQRLGLAVPQFISVSTLIGFLCVVVYARMVMDKDEASNFFQLSGWTLVRFGGNIRPWIEQTGEYWRLGSAMFLHAGLMHLLFNLFALAQIGPQVEEALGRSRFLVLYVVAGLLGSLASFMFLGRGVSIGASGAIMGVIGAGAAFGHRLGTQGGRDFRNRMIQWALYTMIFGLLIRADNWAHGGGFISGAGIGYLMYPAAIRKKPAAAWIVVLGVVSLGLIGWFVFKTVVPELPREPLW